MGSAPVPGGEDATILSGCHSVQGPFPQEAAVWPLGQVLLRLGKGPAYPQASLGTMCA